MGCRASKNRDDSNSELAEPQPATLPGKCIEQPEGRQLERYITGKHADTEGTEASVASAAFESAAEGPSMGWGDGEEDTCMEWDEEVEPWLGIGPWQEEAELLRQERRLGQMTLNKTQAEVVPPQAEVQSKRDPAPAAEPLSEVHRRWQAKMEQMKYGTGLVLVNKLTEAETALREGMEDEQALLSGERDIRAGFALQYALAAVTRGVASLSNDQLSECLERLWHADKLCVDSPDEHWVGKDVIRGACTLAGGVIQILQHSFVKGVFNVLRSWQWISCLQKDALPYDGIEKDAVRSAGLFALGVFNLILSFLPKKMLKSATWWTGFEGSRPVGLEMLMACWKEDGMLAPWAALVLAGFHVDIKTFIGERQTEEDFQLAKDIIGWADERYPHSVFFSAIHGELRAAQKDLKSATRLSKAMLEQAGELKAMRWFACYKRGQYALASLNFGLAGQWFRQSLQVYVDVGRKSMVPYMAMYAAIAYRAAIEAGQGGAKETATWRTEAEDMMALITQHAELPKKKWGRQDKWAFAMHLIYTERATDRWAMLDLVEVMALRMRCVNWMQSSDVDYILQSLESRAQGLSSCDNARRIMCLAEVCHQQGRPQAAEWVEAGLKLQNCLDADERKEGMIQMMYYIKARLAFAENAIAEAHWVLESLEEFCKENTMKDSLNFKVNQLRKAIDQALLLSYHTLKVRHSYTVDVPVAEECEATWDWMIDSHSCDFNVFFVADGARPVEVLSIAKHRSTDGPCSGNHTAHIAGKLRLVWESHSRLRSKVVLLRLQPDSLTCIHGS